MSKFHIVTPSAIELRSPVCDFLRPMLIHRLNTTGNYAPEPDGRSMALYESPFDPAFITSEGAAACLWLGYHEDGLRYLRAQSQQVTAWMVPSIQALPSLMYFLGGEASTGASRIAMLNPNNIDMMMAYQATYDRDGYNIGENEIDEERAPRIGLWLDYEGPKNNQNVMNLLRLVDALRLEFIRQDVYLQPLEFMIATQGAEHMPEMMKTFEFDGELSITFTKDISTMLSWVDVYINLDNAPTAYDPIIAVLGAKPNGPEVIGPVSRFDLLGHNRWLALPPAVNNILEALLHPGSPGIGGMVQNFYPAFLEIVTLIKHSISERDI